MTSSTLDDAACNAGQFPNPTWFTAREQTASRGRRGRAWVAPKGNFYGTLSVIEPNPARAALRSFVASLALADALDALSNHGCEIALKWPNDVLLNGGKVAGILLEGLSGPKGLWGVAVGIGVNLAHAPEPSEVETGAIRPVALVAESGRQVSPDDLLAHLAARFAEWDARLQTLGFAPIRRAWLERAAFRGQKITVKLPHETKVGLFKDIDEAGHLILATAEGDQAIAAGDVFFGG